MTASRSIAWTLVIAVPLGMPLEVYAQVGGYPSSYGTNSRSVPYGSPLDPTGQQQSPSETAQSQATAAAAAQAATRVEPVEFNDSGAEADLSDNVVEDEAEDASGGTIRRTTGNRNRNRTTRTSASAGTLRSPAPPNEFERYVETATGRQLPRFGADLLIPPTRNFALPATATVPPTYVLSPGDRLFIGLSGSINGTIAATIDTSGRIFVPRVGAISVGGVPYGELRATLQRAIGRQYRDFKLIASVTQLRGIRVYVTGYANTPGGYTVGSLSTMVNAVLAAGGPASGGSFRSIKLYRNGQLVSDFDLYDLILRGDKSKDAVLQNEDVLYIEPLGRQIAISGSVNAEAIYEMKRSETLEDMLRFAGGVTALADSSRVILYRVSNKDTIGGQELSRADVARTFAEGGDLIQVLSSATLARSLDRQSVVVRIEGEVVRPGNYYVPANTSLGEVMKMAGGLTQHAFVYGSTLQRLSVRQQQKLNFDEALQQLEVSLESTPLTSDTTVVDAATRESQLNAARTTLNRLKRAEPDGRIVMDLEPGATSLPGDVRLENSDRIYVPPRPVTVGVFGAVYRPASFLVENTGRLRVRDYLEKAGGTVRAADRGEVFVVHANGSVLSRRNGALNAAALPGDVIFVPVRTQGSTVWARIIQLSQLVLSAGISAATIVALSN